MISNLSTANQRRTVSVKPLSEPRPRLFAEFITRKSDIRQAQRLRYEVFCEEFQVTLPVHQRWQGMPIDCDELDDVCKHLVVRDGQTLETIGYTRILTEEGAEQLGKYYSQAEFDMQPVLALQGKKMEIGRTCIHPDYRNGATIAVLWSRLAQFMMENQYRFLFGCASISLTDGGLAYANLMPQLRSKHLCCAERQVRPLLPLEIMRENAEATVSLPPLLKAYMRMGAQVCGEACWDPEFNVADIFVLLDIEQIADRYARHFMKG